MTTNDAGITYEIDGLIFRLDAYGKFHSTTAPAYMDSETANWHIHGVQYDFDNWCKQLNKSDNEKAMLLLRYGPFPPCYITTAS